MKLNNIVTKLWILMTIMLLLVIGVAGAARTSFTEGIYYDQQAKSLVDLGNKVAAIAKSEPNQKSLDDKIALIAGLYNANIMLLNYQNVITHCQGMGMSTNNMPAYMMKSPEHQPLDAADAKSLNSGKVVIHKGYDKFLETSVLSAAIPVRDRNNLIWAVIVNDPLQPLADELARLQWITIYAAVGGIILASLLSLLFSRLISKPLLVMNKAALAMASGDYESRVNINSNDEIGLLANSLNTLASRLQEKITQLETQEQIRREFVTNVSHDIKTPLTIIQAFTETMLDGLVKDETERTNYLNNIMEEIIRLRRLVNEVLDLKRMEEGHFDYDTEPCFLRDIIDKVIKKLRPLARDKEILMDIDMEKRLPQVICNSDRMERVFINLLDNAIRHTPAGGKVIVKAMVKADQVCIQVSDTGVGIPAEDLPMIWERFYKADKSRTRGSGGTGLGLAIVKKIVEGHGGQINVQSKLNQGTTFNIVLPVCRS